MSDEAGESSETPPDRRKVAITLRRDEPSEPGVEA